jgi:8-oxo-dGTP pyrophosphatase MutT (NUDIX family)
VTVFRCPFLEIHHSRATFASFNKDYYVVKFKRRAGVVAIHDGNVLLVRQYRFLPNDFSWELPGGTIGDDEKFEAGIIRECYEETGVRVSALRKLITYYPGLDNVDNRTTVYASESVEVPLAFQGDLREVSRTAWIPVQKSLQMVFAGDILDAMTVAGLLAYHHRQSQPNL